MSNFEPKPITARIAEVIGRMRHTEATDEEIAIALGYVLTDDELTVYADVYDQCCDIIEPMVNRDGEPTTDKPLPASVVESMQVLVQHYKQCTAPVKPKTGSPLRGQTSVVAHIDTLGIIIDVPADIAASITNGEE